MTDRAKKYLVDILQAIDLIERFIGDVDDFYVYQKDLKSKSAIERQLGIIGEAVNQFLKVESDIHLANARLIVDFRNRLIHSYDNVDDAIVWAIIKRHIPTLKTEVTEALDSEN